MRWPTAPVSGSRSWPSDSSTFTGPISVPVTRTLIVPAFVSAALAGEPLQVHGDGRQTRDFTFVRSVTRILCKATRRHVTSGPTGQPGVRH